MSSSVIEKVVKVRDDDPVAEERFVFLRYDHAKGQIVWSSRGMSEEEVREELRARGETADAIDRVIETARLNAA